MTTSAVVLLAAGAGWALLQRYDGNIDRIGGALGLSGVDRPADGSRESTTFLLVGSDSRDGLAPGEGTQGRGDSFVTGQRADTIILAHLFADSEAAQLVSVPRDAYVTIPAHRDPSTGDVVEERTGKINSSFHDGGPPLLVATVERMSGVRVDHYVQVDFTGFKAMVDQLGGVEVCLSEPAREPDSGIDLPAGRQVVAGDQALAFVRQRKGLPRGDIDRIRRQQQFMGAVVRKTLSAGTLLNPLKLNGFLDAATDSLQVDEDLELSDLRDLALRMRGADAGAVTFSTVPVADTAARRGGESVVLLDEPATVELFDRIRRDLPPGAPDPEAEPVDDRPLTVEPEEVTVRVFNGTSRSGLGGDVTRALEDLGFGVAGPPDNRESSTAATVVLHGRGELESARTVAAAIPGARVQLDPSLDGTVEVVVGASYTGVVVPGVGSPAPAAPTPPAAEQPVLTAADDVCGL
ncbi:MAG: LCP family protein [Actinomycetes bacterium]